jgi:hypothetical protein
VFSRNFREARELLSGAVMKRLKTVLSIGAAWTLGLVACAVFADTLRDPIVPPAESVVASAPAFTAPIAVVTPAKPIELDPVVIVGTLPRHHVEQAEVTWSCNAWRPLVQGGVGESVRACEPRTR